MQHRTIGQTDIQIPTVVFGAWAIGGWCWGGADESDAIDAIRAGIDAGMNGIDTAPTYGFGLSESIVGRAIEGRRDEVVIATKCGLRWDTEEGTLFTTSERLDGTPIQIQSVLTRDSLFEECEISLKRLQIETIDLYHVHWPGPNTDFDDAMAALLDLKQQGKIRAIGVSNFSVPLMQNCLKAGALDCNQPKYSLLSRQFENEELPFCRENQVGVVAYSPMEMGLLTGKVGMDRTFPKNDIRSSDFSPWFKLENRKKVLEALDKVKLIADGHGITLAHLHWHGSPPNLVSPPP